MILSVIIYMGFGEGGAYTGEIERLFFIKSRPKKNISKTGLRNTRMKSYVEQKLKKSKVLTTKDSRDNQNKKE